MKILGCDPHAKQQTIAMVDNQTGEFTGKTLSNEGNLASRQAGRIRQTKRRAMYE